MKGIHATYGQLLRVCCEEHVTPVAEAICDVLRSRVAKKTGVCACMCDVVQCFQEKMQDEFFFCYNKYYCVFVFLRSFILKNSEFPVIWQHCMQVVIVAGLYCHACVHVHVYVHACSNK